MVGSTSILEMCYYKPLINGIAKNTRRSTKQKNASNAFVIPKKKIIESEFKRFTFFKIWNNKENTLEKATGVADKDFCSEKPFGNDKNIFTKMIRETQPGK